MAWTRDKHKHQILFIFVDKFIFLKIKRMELIHFDISTEQKTIFKKNALFNHHDWMR